MSDFQLLWYLKLDTSQHSFLITGQSNEYLKYCLGFTIEKKADKIVYDSSDWPKQAASLNIRSLWIKLCCSFESLLD